MTILIAATVFSPAEAQSAQPPKQSGEEERFDDREFHEGLKQRGLSELLDLHLRDFPPRDAASRLLLQREIRLAEWRDTTLPIEKRRAALFEANRLLEQLVRTRTDDRRRFEWQRMLAESYLYDLGEPSFQRILLRGGTTDDRAQLGEAAGKAVETLKKLRADLDAEHRALDALPLPRFEALERQGVVDQLDRLVPLVDYLLAWALMYDVVHRPADDPFRASLLHEAKDLIEGTGVMDQPASAHNPRVPAMLLLGMADRRLNDHGPARAMLEQAVAEAGRMAEVQAKRQVEWAVTLAWIERVRNEADVGQYDAALRILSDFRGRITGGPSQTGLRIAAGLLARSVFRARAEASERAGRSVEADQYRTEAWKPLAALIQRSPESRAEIYAVLDALIDDDADIEKLDPLEQSALIARLLADAGEEDDASDRARRLDRAIAAAERFLSQTDPAIRDLRPEVLFNLAVALYQRGHAEQAVRRFLEITHDHRDYDNAKKATSIAVELCGKLLADAPPDALDRIRGLYLDALESLVTHFADSAEAKYYRFFYAQLLEELGRFDSAATHYGLITPDHEHYLRSRFQQLRCRASALEKLAGGQNVDRVDVRRRIDEFTADYRTFLQQAGNELSGTGTVADKAETRRLLAKATLLSAELQLLPEVDRPMKAIEQIDRCAEEYADVDGLTSRILRIRVRALEQLGQLDEAAEVIPKFIAADPTGAGPTLQSLYGAMVAAWERLTAVGDEAGARAKARAALVLAEQIDGWADGADLSAAQRRALTVQRAEAELRAGLHEAAKARFQRILGVETGPPDPDRIEDWQSAKGYAESLFQLGEHAAALPLFNRLVLGLTPEEPLYWRMLLRDLQCRTALGHDPAGIIRVIEQKQFTHPDLGGSPHAEELTRLLRENRRRANR